ncbi:response regulator [candidate division KSB1 bacterium]|jgi:DNA-binding response OmpR family regulator|nr:response regulator [candidate division KSB1 bacterium]
MIKKILLIDDDVDLVAVNKAHLLKEKFNVIIAYDGKEGLEKAVAEQPDLVVLDVMMNSVGEGFEVAREMKNNPKLARIPILMISSVNQEHGFKLRIGPDENWNPVDDFLEKPVEFTMLIKKVNELLKQKEKLNDHE